MHDLFSSTFNNELFHGFISGIAQSIIGHPLDTYKTWLQVKHIEPISFKSLYRGITYPALTNGGITAVGFWSYEYCKKNFESYGMLYGGILAGATTTGMTCYIDYKKIAHQLNGNKQIPKFPKIGIVTSAMREIPACITYFPTYDFARSHGINPFMSGGIAGITCWSCSYWADVINTNVMSGKTLSSTLKMLKPADYFKGLEIALPRAFIVNATGYFFYELSKSFFT